MKKGRNKILFIATLLTVTITGLLWFGPVSQTDSGMVIITRVPVDIDLSGQGLGQDGRYIPKSQIVGIYPERRNDDPVLLSDGFYAARSPEVSFNGQKMVFTGQKKEGEAWQIFVKELGSGKLSQITNCPVNCTDPTWLPDGRIAFSRQNADEIAGSVHVLYAIGTDGSGMTQLTFQPNSNYAPATFNDGRIAFLSNPQYPVSGAQYFQVMRTDGTKAELFYGSKPDTYLAGKIREANDGRVYFIESNQNGNNGKLISIDFGNPFNSRKNYNQIEDGSIQSVFPSVNGNFYVSFKGIQAVSFGLYELDQNAENLSDAIYSPEEFNVIEAVIVEPRELPMKLPSIVDTSKDKGTLLCIDADMSVISLENSTVKDRKTSRVQVFGLNEMLGEVAVEEDGSFYIEMAADTPVRFQTVNAEGEVLRGHSAWIWVRPNERRTCVGCHADKQMAPPNKVPEAIYSGMYSLPAGTKTEAIVLNKK